MKLDEIKKRWNELNAFYDDYDGIDALSFAEEYIPKLLAVAKAAFDFGQDNESIRKALEELERE